MAHADPGRGQPRQLGCVPAHRGAEISDIDGVKLQAWLQDHGVESLALGQELAKWAMWMANKFLPWTAVCAFLANLMFVLDKEPGTRPVVYREIWHQAITK